MADPLGFMRLVRLLATIVRLNSSINISGYYQEEPMPRLPVTVRACYTVAK
jgi:hypothetical protein